MTDTAGLLVYTMYRLSPDDRGAFHALALRMADAGRAHDGCAFLDVAEDAEDAAVARLVEGWRDQASLDAFGASAGFQAVLKEASALHLIDRTIDVYTIAGKRRVQLP